ncbi:MAG: Na+/H+ antiporter NhaC family protein [Bacteroidales bacterium]|nr:Na+/H+ antiporter NhaC family protein [Bacteroidales bacterium]
MTVTPYRYLRELGKTLSQHRPQSLRPHNNWMALSPLAVFLVVYLVSSIVAGDFYKVPIVSAFLIAAVYAIAISRGGDLDRRVVIFSEGAGNKSVLLMIWIFVLAGAFASTAKEIGAVDATVTLTTSLLPGNLLLAGMFVASCLVSMAVGTSVGTIAALMPIAAGLSEPAGIDIAMMAAAITGGAFFGDNLSFISDTTIAATRTQGCKMSEKFKANLALALPAAIIVCVIYVIAGSGATEIASSGDINIVKVLPYLAVIALAIGGINVMVVLLLGIVINGIIGFACGDFGWVGYLESIGRGIASMGDLIIVTMLAGGVLEIIRYNGGIDFVVARLTSRIKGRRGAELCIAALVSLANLCTANNTIAIISTGEIARNITEKYGLRPRRTASLLDTFSCIVQGILPYGAQLLMAAGLAGVGALSIIRYLYYPLVLFFITCLSIVFAKGAAESKKA